MALKEPPPYVAGHQLLAGKSVMITAAAGAGIGFAAATRAAEEGCRALMISDVHEKRLAQAVDKLKAETGLERVYGRLANVTVEEDVQALINEAEDKLGGVDVHSGMGGRHVLAFIHVRTARSCNEKCRRGMFQCIDVRVGKTSENPLIDEVVVYHVAGNPGYSLRAAESFI